MGETGARLGKYLMWGIFLALVILSLYLTIFTEHIALDDLTFALLLFMCVQNWEFIHYKIITVLLGAVTFAGLVVLHFVIPDWFRAQGYSTRAAVLLLLLIPFGILLKFAVSAQKKARIAAEAAEAARLERNRLYRQRGGVWGGSQQ